MTGANGSIGAASGDEGQAHHAHHAHLSAFYNHLHEVKMKLQSHRERHSMQDHQRRRAFFITAAEEQDIVAKMYPPNSLPVRLSKFLHSERLQLTLTALLVIDVLIVVSELFIDAEWPACSIIERDAISCCAADYNASGGSGAGGGGAYGRMLAYGDSLCGASLVESAHAAACDKYKHSGINSLHLALFIFSVSILACFEAELILLLAVLRQNFARNRLYLIDLFIVTTALFLEVYIKVSKLTGDVATSDLAGVLTFARLWRFVRLGHGLVTSVHEASQKQVDEMQSYVDGLVQHVASLQQRLDALEGNALADAGGKAAKKFGNAQGRFSITDSLSAVKKRAKAVRKRNSLIGTAKMRRQPAHAAPPRNTDGAPPRTTGVRATAEAPRPITAAKLPPGSVIV